MSVATDVLSGLKLLRSGAPLIAALPDPLNLEPTPIGS